MTITIKDIVKIERGAIFSPCALYRYLLWRVWDTNAPPVLFIGLNPSTADERRDDPTIRRCIRFAREWGYGGVWVANLFSFRATRPEVLKKAAEPVGPENDHWLLEAGASAGLLVAAWGAHGTFLQRDRDVPSWFPELHHLGVTKDGHPRHPLYLKRSCKPTLFPRPDS